MRRDSGLRLGLQKTVQRRATFVTQRDEWAKRECAISADLAAKAASAIIGFRHAYLVDLASSRNFSRGPAAGPRYGTAAGGSAAGARTRGRGWRPGRAPRRWRAAASRRSHW